MRTLVGLALIAKIVSGGLRLAGALLLTPFRAAALVAPGPAGVVARRALMGVGGGTAIAALLIARARAAGVERVSEPVTDRVDAFVVAGREALARDLAQPEAGSHRVMAYGHRLARSQGHDEITPRDTSLAALLEAAREAALHPPAHRGAQHRGGGR